MWYDIHMDTFEPMAGSSYIELPEKLKNKKAIINVKNTTDHECFQWAITSAVCTQKKDPQRRNKLMRKDAKKFDWTGISFPTPFNQIKTFEKNNPGYEIWAFGWKNDKVYPIRPGKDNTNKTKIDLLYIKNDDTKHYCWIKDIDKLCFSQASKHESKKPLCRRCVRFMHSKKALEEHRQLCFTNESVRIEMPEESTELCFKNHNRKMRVPFVVYADFECITEPILEVGPKENKSTDKYQQHKPCGFTYLIKCFNDRVYYPKLERCVITSFNDDI